jgi:hypothetical protein
MESTKVIRVNHTFNAPIEKVFQMITNPVSYVKIFSPFIEDFKYLNEGKTYATKGAEFIYTWKKIMPVLTLHVKVIEVVDDPNYKMINLYFQAIKPKSMKFNTIYKFCRVSTEMQTFMAVGIFFNSYESFHIHDCLLNDEEKLSILKNMENYLLEQYEFYQEEAIILEADIQRVWEVVTNWKDFKRHVPEVAEEVTVEYNQGDEDNTIELIKLKENKTEQSLKVVTKEFNGNIGVYTMTTTEGANSPPQEIIFRLLSIDCAMCYLVVRHNFYEPVPCKYVQLLSKKKKRILKTLEKSLKIV